MFEKTEMERAVNAAEKTQSAQSKVSSVIKSEEMRLTGLIKDRLSAERAVANAEAAVALGEAGDSKSAQRTLDAVMINIGKQSVKLSGLRSRMAELAPEIEAKRKAIAECLPDHVESLKAEFTVEWMGAVTAFEKVMARHAALQQFAGKFDLPQPRVMSGEMPAATRAPWQAMEALAEGLNEISGWSYALLVSETPLQPGQDRRPFDRDAVYEVLEQPGEPVIEASFAPGVLRNLIQCGNARLYASRDWESSLHSGTAAARRMRQDEQTRLAEQREAEQRQAQRPAQAVQTGLLGPYVHTPDPNAGGRPMPDVTVRG